MQFRGLKVNGLDHLDRGPLSSIVASSRSALGLEAELLVKALRRLNISTIANHVNHKVEVSVGRVSAELLVENGLLQDSHDGRANSGLLKARSHSQNVHMAVGLLVRKLASDNSSNGFGILSVGIQLTIGQVVAEGACGIEELHVELNVVRDGKGLMAKLVNSIDILVLHGLELVEFQLESLGLVVVGNRSFGEVGQLVESRRRRQRLIVVCRGIEGDSLG